MLFPLKKRFLASKRLRLAAAVVCLLAVFAFATGALAHNHTAGDSGDAHCTLCFGAHQPTAAVALPALPAPVETSTSAPVQAQLPAPFFEPAGVPQGRAPPALPTQA